MIQCRDLQKAWQYSGWWISQRRDTVWTPESHSDEKYSTTQHWSMTRHSICPTYKSKLQVILHTNMQNVHRNLITVKTVPQNLLICLKTYQFYSLSKLHRIYYKCTTIESTRSTILQSLQWVKSKRLKINKWY